MSFCKSFISVVSFQSAGAQFHHLANTALGVGAKAVMSPDLGSGLAEK